MEDDLIIINVTAEQEGDIWEVKDGVKNTFQEYTFGFNLEKAIEVRDLLNQEIEKRHISNTPLVTDTTMAQPIRSMIENPGGSK